MASENENGEERTEQPSAKHLQNTRKEGQVAKSVDFAQLAHILAAFIAIKLLAPIIWQNIVSISKYCLSSQLTYTSLTIEDLRFGFVTILMSLAPGIIGIMFFAAFFGVLATCIQTKFLFSPKLLIPKFSKLNPLKGIKRIFSANNIVNLLKNIIKLSVILPMAYFSLLELMPGILQLSRLPISEFFPFASFAVFAILKKILALLIIIALFDYGWNFYKHSQEVKQTKQETKDERKNENGDEQTKARIRQIAMKRIRDKMMKELPTADVVITNPTHFAVAIKYDPKQCIVPRVVAKGQDHFAQLIRKRAKELGIPVIERKPLARALFAAVEVGQEIPYTLYKAVAELLGYVYQITGKKPPKK